MVYKKSIIVIILFLGFKVLPFAQELLSPTLTNAYTSYTKRVNYLSSMGEVFVGVKNIKNHTIIEGFYSFNTFKFDSISYQISQCKVFPNPSRESFVIYNENNDFNIKIDIYDISGIIIKSYDMTANSIVNVNDLKTGIYILKITSDEKLNIKQSIHKQIVI